MSLDAIGDGDGGLSPPLEVGRLQAFNSVGTLLGTDTTAGLAEFAVETMTVSSATPIAYILATFTGTDSGSLDNLRFQGAGFGPGADRYLDPALGDVDWTLNGTPTGGDTYTLNVSVGAPFTGIVTIAANDTFAEEKLGGTPNNGQFTISASTIPVTPLVVTYQVDITLPTAATAGADYQLTGLNNTTLFGTITIPAGIARL